MTMVRKFRFTDVGAGGSTRVASLVTLTGTLNSGGSAKFTVSAPVDLSVNDQINTIDGNAFSPTSNFVSVS